MIKYGKAADSATFNTINTDIGDRVKSNNPGRIFENYTSALVSGDVIYYDVDSEFMDIATPEELAALMTYEEAVADGMLVPEAV